MNNVFKNVVCLVMLLVLPALCLFASINAFNPPELFECEDLGDIIYPIPPEMNEIVPEGTYVETTCGIALVGYRLSSYYDTLLDDDIYTCEYVGTFINRCYLIQTNGFIW